MKCGYCKNEMIKGFIPTPAIEWCPENGSKVWMRAHKRAFKPPRRKSHI